MASIDPDDEEAFHWAGDEVGGREGARLPSGQVPDAVAGVGAEIVPADPAPRSAGVATLLSALFAIGYLALTVGWIIGTGYASAGTAQVLPQLLWQFGEFTAIIAAPLWYGTVLLLTRGARLRVRVGWLALGLGMLLPWPVLPLLVVS